MNHNNNGDALLAGGITRDCIESAYCFIHQKLRVFRGHESAALSSSFARQNGIPSRPCEF